MTRAPASSGEPEVQDLLAQLAARYQDVLPQRVAELERALAELRANPEDLDARSRARHLSHRLAGTAGAFGFEEVSACARLIEDLLNEEGGPGWRQMDDAAKALRTGRPGAPGILAR